MQHANWTRALGNTRYVSIEDVRRELGKDKARRQTYHCPSENCGAKMITVFPDEKRSPGKEVHKEHFRAPRGHEKGCSGDGARTESTVCLPSNETDAKPLHGVVKTSRFPMRYFVRPHLPRDRLPGDDDQSLPPDLPTEEDVDDRTSDFHTSEAATGHIRGIVEAYENPPAKLSDMKLRLPRSNAKNYAEAFVDVRKALDYRGHPLGHYIYYGNYREHRIYANKAISIILSHLSPRGWKFGVWIKPRLEPQVAWDQINGMLESWSHEKHGRIYVFGRFEPFGGYKYTIEIETFGDLWITYPSQSSSL